MPLLGSRAMRIFQYPGCSTCRRASKFLAAAGASVESIDLVVHPPSADTLKDLHQRSGLPLKKFFNVAGRSYRGGNFKKRLPGMSEAEQFAALAADGKLIKRPIFDTGDQVLVGFREAEWTEALG